MAVWSAVVTGWAREQPRIEPVERPTTALDRERDRRAVTVLHEVDALIMGGAE